MKEEHQDFLRFLWWPEADLSKELEECKMIRHIQGATSSPSVSNFALHQTAKDNKSKYSEEVSNTLLRNFYVDDMLKTKDTEDSAVKLLDDVKRLCHDGGFNLTKLGSNSRKVIESISEEHRMKEMKSLEPSSPLPIERVLGVSWAIENDVFNFKIVLQDKPLTKRGILSTISSIYDPLGFAAPVMLPAKKLLQKLTSDKNGWDDDIHSEDRYCWEK